MPMIAAQLLAELDRNRDRITDAAAAFARASSRPLPPDPARIGAGVPGLETVGAQILLLAVAAAQSNAAPVDVAHVGADGVPRTITCHPLPPASLALTRRLDRELGELGSRLTLLVNLLSVRPAADPADASAVQFHAECAELRDRVSAAIAHELRLLVWLTVTPDQTPPFDLDGDEMPPLPGWIAALEDDVVLRVIGTVFRENDLALASAALLELYAPADAVARACAQLPARRWVRPRVAPPIAD